MILDSYQQHFAPWTSCFSGEAVLTPSTLHWALLAELNKPPVIYDLAPAAYPQAMLKSPA